jgi:hypothetical protein
MAARKRKQARPNTSPEGEIGAGQNFVYRLQPNERAALRQLRLNWGDRTHRREFQQTVLCHLAGIRTSQGGTYRVRVAESFQRRAKAVRSFIQRMGRPMSTELAKVVAQREPPSPWLRFPANELSLYADACEAYAKLRAGKPRHSPAAYNEQIVKLLNFVRQYTGRPHLPQLAILLRRPCGDVGMNARRLSQLLSDHGRRSPEVRYELLKARSGIIAVLAEKALR